MFVPRLPGILLINLSPATMVCVMYFNGTKETSHRSRHDNVLDIFHTGQTPLIEEHHDEHVRMSERKIENKLYTSVLVLRVCTSDGNKQEQE